MNKERRKALQAIIDQLETLQSQLEEIQTEEEECRDNIPENFQSELSCIIRFMKSYLL